MFRRLLVLALSLASSPADAQTNRTAQAARQWRQQHERASVNGPVIQLPMSGGAVPLEMIERATGSRTIIIPIANHDDNQHGFDENIRLENLWDGIELMAALLKCAEWDARE